MLKLVIVEDETNIRDCLVNLFPWETMGIEVASVFSNGTDAFRYLTRNHADILLTDIRLPGISGLELARDLREAGQSIAIIILTGYKQFDYARQALRYQVNDFLLKPVKYDELTVAVLKVKEALEASKDPEEDREDTVLAEESSYHERIILNAKRYVKEHLAKASLESAAVEVNLSPGYFSRLFHKVTGVTFFDYVTECRMKRAKELLQNIDLKIYEIAIAVGYDNPKNFTRMFRQYYGISPRDYRDNAGALPAGKE